MESDIVGESGGTKKRQRVSHLTLDWTAANHWADIFSTERHRVGVVLRIHRMLMVGEQKEEAWWQRGVDAKTRTCQIPRRPAKDKNEHARDRT
jgi:hypothetical protein